MMNFLDFDMFVNQNFLFVLFLLFYRDELYIYSSCYDTDKSAAVMLT